LPRNLSNTSAFFSSTFLCREKPSLFFPCSWPLATLCTSIHIHHHLIDSLAPHFPLCCNTVGPGVLSRFSFPRFIPSVITDSNPTRRFFDFASATRRLLKSPLPHCGCRTENRHFSPGGFRYTHRSAKFSQHPTREDGASRQFYR
jgi:hypothetical protein